MSKLGARRPSPALVISIIALFVAIGGSAYAAQKIGTKEIKNNAITAPKIKKDAVTTAKIKNNAVSGVKIAESSLESVPNATNAVNATNATNAVNATNAENFDRYLASGVKATSVGVPVTVLTVGPFTLTGKCTDSGGGYVKAETYLTTSQIGSSVYGYSGSYYEGNFNPGMEVQVAGTASDNSTYIYWSSNYGSATEFRAASADGKTVLVGEAVDAVFYAGGQCAFWASAMNQA